MLDALDFIPDADKTIVVGYKKEYVTAAFPQVPSAVQEQQLGTGHAVMSARERFENFDGGVLICCGDMPLLRRETYRALVETHFAEGNDCTILTGTSPEALPYGRIIRDGAGRFLEMVEEKDCTPEQRQIRELNSGVYVFNGKKLAEVLSSLRCDNAQGEYYLTDAPRFMRERGEKIGICCRELGSEIIGVNTLEQLRQVEEILRSRGQG